jgi:hypothetical protein
MIPQPFLRVLLCALPLLTSCVVVDPWEFSHSVAQRRRGPLPESEWNARGLWQRVATSPATYIPKGYPVSAPRDDAHGTWLVDQRDGKRVFVPDVKVGDLEPGVLIGEARKFTRPLPLDGIYYHVDI